MSIEVAVLISGISLAFAIYQGVSNLKRNKAADDKKDASEMATVIVELRSISKDTTEIKNDIKDVKQDVKNNTEEIIRLDESLKSAWKRINTLEARQVAELEKA